MTTEAKRYPPNAVIIDIKPTDFVAGGETGIGALAILDPHGQYDPYLPDEETQYDFYFDTYACVTFSGLNGLEIRFNFMMANGLISADNLKWLKDNAYIDYRTGKVNFSDRFTAKMSGTTNGGNSLGNVGDSARNHGLVPESSWPWPKEMQDGQTQAQKWAEYYAEIPQAVKDLGLEFKKRFDVSYQWIILGNQTIDEQHVTIKKYLPYGPIQIATAVCSPWNSNEGMPPINGCGCGTQHATLVYGYTDLVSVKDFDHYRSFKKLLAWDYCLTYAMQYYVNEKVMSSKPTPPAVNLAFNAPDSSAVRSLQACLQYLKSPSTQAPYMKSGVFGPFGPQTKDALARFQVDNGIPNSPQGTNYGPKTRAKMTELINK